MQRDLIAEEYREFIDATISEPYDAELKELADLWTSSSKQIEEAYERGFDKGEAKAEARLMRGSSSAVATPLMVQP